MPETIHLDHGAEPSPDAVPSRRPTWLDFATAAALLLAATVLSWPILRDGWRTYLDNPGHIAEIRSLAADGWSGWSPIGFAGFSLDALHSPLFWRGLALLLRAGLPLPPLYAACVVLGVAAPALALFAVARRRTATLPAGLLASLLLIQRPTLVGTAAATGGMWAFYIASGLLILLADRLTRPTFRRRDVAAIAALLGLIGLTHLFVLVAAVLLMATVSLWSAFTAPRPLLFRRLRRDGLAALIAVAIAMPYWLPMLLTFGYDARPPQNLRIAELAQLLVLPTDVIDVLSHSARFSGATALPFAIEALPVVLLLLLGLLAVRPAWRERAAPLPLVGVLFACVIAILLLVARPLHLTLLGPVSWRFLYFVRVGCALAAIALLPRLTSRALVVGGFVAVLAATPLFVRPLAAQVAEPQSPELQEVAALWQSLAAHKGAATARVYVQDTFMTPPLDAALARSHLLALTTAETGIATVGAQYGVVPSSTAPFVRSEFGRLFGAFPGSPALSPQVLAQRIGQFAVDTIVTATPEAAAWLTTTGLVQLQQQFGRFHVFRVLPLPTSATLRLPLVAADTLVLDVDAQAGQPIALSHAFHPFWSVAEGPLSAQLVAGDAGLMTLVGLPPGRQHVVLRYEPPTGTWAVGLAGWLAVILLWRRRD